MIDADLKMDPHLSAALACSHGSIGQFLGGYPAYTTVLCLTLSRSWPLSSDISVNLK